MKLHPIAAALFLPMLLWTGSVVAVTLSGYPGVVCVTPLAWLLAVPVGLRVAHESESPRAVVLQEGMAAGATLGFWQAMLLAAAMAMTPYVDSYPEPLPNPWLVGAAGALIGTPVTALLGRTSAWLGLQRSERKDLES